MAQPVLYARWQDERWQTLREHSQNVAEQTSRAGEAFGLSALLRLCGLLHDLGKASEAFQEYLPKEDATLRGTVIHAAQGALYALRRWGMGKDLNATLTAQWIAVAIASHHGRLPDLLSERGEDYFARKLAEELPEPLEATVARFAAQVAEETELDALFAQAREEFTSYSRKLLTACDGLDKDNRETAVHHLMGLTQRMIFGALIDADRWDANCFETGEPVDAPAPSPWEEWARSLENRLAGFVPRNELDHLRADVAADCLAMGTRGAGIYRLSVPTGGGKTFSSMRFALAAVRNAGMERIVYAAPYKTILEQTAKRLRETLGKEELILEHHSDVIFDDKDENCDKKQARYKLLSERWNPPLTLTTMVQLLDTLFAGRSASVRRFPALSRCVIILDEVQCVPLRCWHLMTLAIRYLTRLAGCAVVLCTATQPMWDTLPAFPLPLPIPMVREEARLYDRLQRVHLRDRTLEGELTAQTLAAEVTATLTEVGSALCILNTKRCAMELFDALRAELPESVPLYCLTTLQCPAHRLKLLEQIRALLSAGQPVVCVATQLIEAGVDVSFGLTVRAMAGLESLAQAAGRCNRNAERAFGMVWLVRVAGEKLSALPDIAHAQTQARKAINHFPPQAGEAYQDVLLTPKAMETYFKILIRENAPAMSYPLTGEGAGCTLLDLLSVNHPGRRAYQTNHAEKAFPGFSAQAYRQAGDTFRALESPTTAVAVPWEEGKQLLEALAQETDLKAIRKLLRRLQLYSVAIYEQDLTRLQQNHALTRLENVGVWAVDDKYYSKELGLTSGNGELDFLNT